MVTSLFFDLELIQTFFLGAFLAEWEIKNNCFNFAKVLNIRVRLKYFAFKLLSISKWGLASLLKLNSVLGNGLKLA